MQPLRIALVGAGWVTEHHLRAYGELGDRVEVTALADPDPTVRADRAERWGVPRTFASDAEMLAAVEVDAVDVANPREHHAASVERAVAAGLPVLCQKPLAPTWEEARALVDRLPHDARLMVHENWRYRPHFARIREWVAEGRIGRLRQATLLARTSGFLPDETGALPALTRQPMLAGLSRMLLMEVLIHHVDTVRSIVGEMELLAAVLGNDTAELQGEDRATMLLRTNSGAAVTLIGDFRTHGQPGGLSDELELQGTDGAIRLEGDRLTLFRRDETLAEDRPDLAANYTAAYRDAIAAFVEAVATGQGADHFRAQVEDNLRSLALVEQAYAMSGFHSPPPRAA
ncbi:Gfo/Idh/MocA family protein [Pelagovum pacificum]|uniref:Gfo/Idh/MocA family oxidoreductase n=1 Tax=Pelagovum pacificum TaxID=2588711 RepID=A0A5C5G9G1_9RHOB|nr:Gfo/Idh/MocA family oxidoreductase [Pelagovum pacificum]QQA41940.1 Gfo/Idh/MocA family oxidoreductase [Pelagovum pacificum]TNY30620.1 Gfo/Idh/MocA family oxidoreductase [Pelagovum pacificum]